MGYMAYAVLPVGWINWPIFTWIPGCYGLTLSENNAFIDKFRERFSHVTEATGDQVKSCVKCVCEDGYSTHGSEWNIFQWNSNNNTIIFIQENAFENLVCEMAAN